MNNEAPLKRPVSPLLWVGLGLTLAMLLLGLLMAVLRVSNANNPSQKLPILGTVADFALTNQAGRIVSLNDLRGHVWVADIIFSRCAGPCPRMTKQMSLLQGMLPANARLITLTTDPDFDTPEVLSKYALRFGADTNRWQFLTGTKAQIAALATGSLKLTGLEKAPEQRQDPADLFIHSTIFVVVDKQGRLRGVFETEGEDVPEAKARAAILASVKKLESER